MESEELQNPINPNSSPTHNQEQEDHHQDQQHLNFSPPPSSYNSEDDESNRLDKDDTLLAKQSPPKNKNPNPRRPYKIPSFVFARTNTTAPAEWSTVSNESLFSIHMGNSSFTRDFLNSEELVVLGDSSFSGSLLDLTEDQLPLSYFSTENDAGEPTLGAVDEEIGRTNEEDKAAQNLKGEIITKQSEDTSGGRLLTGQEIYRSISHHSDGSTKSFAFPILGGGEKLGGSLRVNPHAKQRKASQSQLQVPQPETPKIMEPRKEKTKEVKTTEAHQQIQTPKKNSTRSTRTNSSNSRWLSCFPCCATSFG